MQPWTPTSHSGAHLGLRLSHNLGSKSCFGIFGKCGQGCQHMHSGSAPTRFPPQTNTVLRSPFTTCSRNFPTVTPVSSHPPPLTPSGRGPTRQEKGWGANGASPGTLGWKTLFRSKEDALEWVFCGLGGGVGGSSPRFMASSMEVLEYDLQQNKGRSEGKQHSFSRWVEMEVLSKQPRPLLTLPARRPPNPNPQSGEPSAHFLILLTPQP